MDELGLKRYCCRRMLMTHVDLIEKLLKYVECASVKVAYADGLSIADTTLRIALDSRWEAHELVKLPGPCEQRNRRPQQSKKSSWSGTLFQQGSTEQRK